MSLESVIKKSELKQIEYEDDIVIVFDESDTQIYKGIEDYEPMNNEDWKWNSKTKLYEYKGYKKVCIDV